MKSAAAITYELDDIGLAVEELANQLESFVLLKNSAGILYCDSTVDLEPLLQALEERFPFAIAGCTTIGVINGEAGFSEACITLTVVTGDDCDFRVALSGPIDADNVEQALADAYREGLAGLEGDPRLILIYPSYRLDVVLEVYSEILGRVSGGVPVFGGVPSRLPDAGENAILAKGGAYQDRLVMLIFSGNLRPVCTVSNLLGTVAVKKRTITKARDNVIYRVGDQTFTDFLQGLGLSVRDYHLEDGTWTYITNPLVIQPPGGEPLVRTIYSLNPADGSGTIIGTAVEGSIISVGSMNRHDIRASAQEGTDRLLRKMAENQQDGYRYTLILAVSCMARFMIMAPDNDMEGKVLTSTRLGPKAISGFYANAEMCPTSIHDGTAANYTHNQSIVLCAL